MKKLIPILFLIPFFANANPAGELTKYAMLENIDVWLSKGKSTINKDIPTYNASSLIKEFDENEFAYIEKHNKLPVRVQTVVSGIKMDFSKVPYIQANGKNQFEFVTMYAKNKDDLTSLKKGQKIDMACKGTDKNVMGVVLVDCITVKDYSNLLLDNVTKRLNNNYEGIEYQVDFYKNVISSVLSDNESPIKESMSEKEKKDTVLKWFNANADKFKTQIEALKSANPDIDFKSLPIINLP